ncbi:hypothetical protein [Umezawaea sp. Da 62-37]|uniref:hypothetical protein n=1 Tax=Umezawaea sp. Da 62-37 TaxID=3075927 RepID=UPI0028F6C9BA|nr:hypothetical protein [Umezawaea sp. Da 62-37]WNV88900.1 hypothetical protein RM788_11540 [Umezawaea sp. Da 62-37]
MSIGTIARRAAVVAGAAALGLGASLVLSAPASAETNPSCSSVTQIGVTGHVTVGGANVASVKQFKGCGKNWAYTYVWEGYRSNHSSWEVCTGVATGSSGPFTLEGLKCNNNKVENWSSGTATLSVCTHAIGTLPSDSRQEFGKTDIRC